MNLVELETVELPLCRELRRGHHEIRRQVVVPGGRVDVFDETTSEIIECKPRGDLPSLVAATAQLYRYKPFFFDPQLAIAVPHLEDGTGWFVRMLARENIRIIEVEKSVCI